MSSNDGNHNPHEDAYHYHQHPNMAPVNNRDMSRSQHRQHQQLHMPDATIPLSTQHQMMWTNNNPNMPPPLRPQQPHHPFVQQIPAHLAAQHMQQPQIPTHSRQQRYNDYMFNMHQVQTYVQPTIQPETYSVLPVGHGNFLKVYHCNEAPTINEITAAGIFQQPPSATQSHQHPPQQAQQPSQHFQTMPLQQYPIQTLPTQHRIQHEPQQYKHHVAGDISEQATKATATTTALTSPQETQSQQIFNSYELFSSNPLLPAACDNRNITLNLATQHDITTNTITNNRNNHTTENDNQKQDLNDGVNAVTVTTTNMIINKLVNNWSPNLTGVAYTQFSSPTPPLPVSENIELAVMINQENLEQQQPQQNILKPIKNNDRNEFITNAATSIESEIDKPIASTMPATTSRKIATNTNTNMEVSNLVDKATLSYNNSMNKTTFKTNNCNNNIISYNKNTLAPEAKKRIVAEVKPMRMSYSDVLSKANHAQPQNVQNNNNRNGKLMCNSTQLFLNTDRKNNNSITTITNGVNKKTAVTGADVEGRSNKKSPTHEQKENYANNNNNKNNNNNRRFSSNNNNNNSNGQGKNLNQKQNATIITGKQSAIVNDISNNNNSTTNNNVTIAKKRNNNINNNSNNNYININKKSTTNTANNNNINNGSIERENELGMRKTFASSATTTTATTQSTSSLNTKASYVRHRSSGNSSLSNNSSYSYSTKRNRNSYYTSSSVGTGGSPGAGTYGSYGAATNRNYELAKKLLNTWCEYAFKVLTWLYYLLYDIVVLSCSIAYDNIKQHSIDAWWTICHLRAGLQQNSNKPGIWWRNFCSRFDSRFSKNSRWAFWRRYFAKKPPTTANNETFKGGRLPQTGEEAMYSLLNCKGKNAYSILGVPPDSSQEQIRKHYKKIAVLVHPDKNKQAGAEEAFKVLQRAFELIGEPENRLAYDTSLAQALHAEKTWTEFHDLLSQLHTKITEAANTIRCSTCSLRHPRKLTDRPHYAARECASCKIRHSAREGDIWAESTMMGLRWKYLALMEGKVYDITEWANCQKGALSHLEPNSHMVQYRIVRGAQQQQQQQQQQQSSGQKQQRQQGPVFDSGGFGASTNAFASAAQFSNDLPSSDASLHEFLDNLYSGQNPNQAQSTSSSNSSRRRSRRN